ncbi:MULTISPECIES: hypothetical protein [Cyanophyceae]|uniref:hypothetical protein n=1 Tax=Cyanophyceae TaxID=3028117 RepID=UPI0016856C67|nr:hypothetical protein [Microcoleus sp. FACHB-831]MBD1921959.1 hypothetical protein [Microcoleus sp. FACHB-831]
MINNNYIPSDWEKSQITTFNQPNIHLRNQLAQQIDISMSRIPSSLLLKHAYTGALVSEWISLNQRAQYMGECLKARFSGAGENPLFRQRQENLIDETSYLIAMTVIEVHDATFSLIQGGWKYIYEEIKNLENYPKDEISFFLETLKQKFDYFFIEAVKGYKTTVRDIENRSKRLRDLIYKGDLWTEELVSEQFAKYEIWIGIAINTCAKRQEEDNVIKNLMKNFLHKYALSHDLSARLAQKERSANPPRYIQSIRWKDGQRYVGKKGGWELVVTKLNEPNPVFGLSLLFPCKKV